MRKIIALVLVGIFAASAAAQKNPVPLAGADWASDDIITIVYDPAGTWHVEHPTENAGANAITTFELTSSADFFTGAKPASFAGLFDVYNSTKAFRLDPGGFTSLAGSEAVPGLGAAAVSEMLTINGSFAGGGNIADGVDLRVVPEPSAIVLIGLGGLAFLSRRRK